MLQFALLALLCVVMLGVFTLLHFIAASALADMACPQCGKKGVLLSESSMADDSLPIAAGGGRIICTECGHVSHPFGDAIVHASEQKGETATA